MNKIMFIIANMIACFLISCSNSADVEPHNGAPYAGERAWDSIFVSPIISTMKVNETYTINYKLVSKFEMAGNLYLMPRQTEYCTVIVNDAQIYSGSANNTYIKRFHTSNDNNEFDFSINVKINRFSPNPIDGGFVWLDMQADSIKIDQDTLFRQTIEPTSNIYAFPVKEKRWYIINNLPDSDIYYLDQYFDSESFNKFFSLGSYSLINIIED